MVTNSIVQDLYKRYQDTLEFDKISLANTFEEVYDVSTLLPLTEHYQQYHEVYEELQSIGVPLK